MLGPVTTSSSRPRPVPAPASELSAYAASTSAFSGPRTANGRADVVEIKNAWACASRFLLGPAHRALP
eukprot:4081671-Prymnesium_polylepis.1